MSIRRTIESLLQDEQQQEAFRASPESFFAEHGIEDIPGELIGTAFVHYSDTAPIEHGDAVAGIATHYSAVPFEADDLPDLSFGASEGSTPFASLGLLAGDELSETDAGLEEPTDPTDDFGDRFGEAIQTEDLTEGDDVSYGDPEPDAGLDDTTDGDDIDSASFHDREFDDGFDEAELLDHADETGFGDGSHHHTGPTEILGEIHGGGPLDPQIDDPFFEDVTDDGLTTVHLEFEPIDFEHESLQHEVDHHLTHEAGHELGHELAHDGFVEHHHADAYHDVDPGDLDLDDF